MPYDHRTVEHRFLVAVDVQGYGARNDLQQRQVHGQLEAMLVEASKHARLRRTTWTIRRSDGELAVLPLNTSSKTASALIDDYPRSLAAALRRHNADRRDDMRLRVRMAIHYGVTAEDRLGVSGQGVVEVSRLLDCPQVRGLLSGPVDVVVALSQALYSAVIPHARTSLDESDFVQIRAQHKEFSQLAHVYAPLFKPPWLPGDQERLEAHSLAQLLAELYPDHPPAHNSEAYADLAHRLDTLGYRNIGDVRQRLSDAFEEGKRYAERHPPLAPFATPHYDVGVARMTLAMTDPRVTGRPLRGTL